MIKNFFDLELLQDDYKRIYSSARSGIPTAVFGVSDVNKYFTASLFKGKTVYVTSNAQAAKKAAESISAFCGEEVVYLPAKDEVLLYKNALSKDSLFLRTEALYKIQCGARFVATDIEALIQLFPKNVKSITFKKNCDYDFITLSEKLVGLGYSREFEIESKGTFALRGDILDIYPVNGEHPYRIDFFGDTVEAIRPYDIDTKERLPFEDEITVIGASDIFVEKSDENKILTAIDNSLKRCKNSAQYTRMSEIAEEVVNNLYTPASASFLMSSLSNAVSFFEFIDGDSTFIFDEPSQIYDRIDALEKEHGERFKSLYESGEVFPFALGQFISPEDTLNGIARVRKVGLQLFASPVKLFNALRSFNYKSAPVSNYLNSIPELFKDVSSWLTNKYRVVLCCGDAGRTQKMRDALYDNGFSPYELPVNCSYLKGVSVCENYVEKGMILHEDKIVVVGTGNMYTKTGVQKRIKRRRGDVFTAPEIGDFAVHEIHGVGRIRGTQKIESSEGVKEYVAVEYGGGDMLYVPVEQIDTLTKYTGGDSPKLSKIGGQEFARVKERVRNSLKKLAFDLKALYAERQKKQGYVFPENKEMMDEFASAFEFTETADQMSSITEVVEDMTSGKVMDRLLCGDVGFGKTEVAFRAIFLCVLGGKQAVLMCPSTILCQQHYKNAVERFKNFGVNVEVLNRFKSPKEQEDILNRLAKGKIDLLVGTHRLLSKDVKFNDLGLLVLDEEQRFGVEHKEKLKTLKNSVDCLTMTATPIPRTLHMSLSGIRDISTIETPPSLRLPVQTYVLEESEALLRDACIRELSRGGQIFVLYNRVESIHSFAQRLKEIVPEAEITVAHGRMEKATLERNVYGFYEGKSNVLVTTTIIENGIDLPNANTIIIIDADRLGVSQLYQLRGRVGRGNKMAHAYFTYKPQKVMTEEATKRLQAIMEFTSLGSGFKIAMRDLQIRGAGNVLGAEQHGHMDKVGYELYSKLLKEEITGEEQGVAELEINATAYIPEKYMESSSIRMDAYKQIAEIRTVEDYKRVCASLEESYGKIPSEVHGLLVIAVLKGYCTKFAVNKIVVNSKRAAIEFKNINAINKDGLKSALEKYKSQVSLSMVNCPAIEFPVNKNPVLTMRGMIKFLKYAELSLV